MAQRRRGNELMMEYIISLGIRELRQTYGELNRRIMRGIPTTRKIVMLGIADSRNASATIVGHSPTKSKVTSNKFQLPLYPDRNFLRSAATRSATSRAKKA
jgi:hypothetical protein